jgi:predicted adenine nucleotide alpha hydrolase (AANH) superfamily ATPase
MKILLHMCCSNCSLYPVKILRSENHQFNGFWFNPNIHPHEEHALRLDSLKKLSEEWKFDVLYSDDYRPEDYLNLFGISIPEFMSSPDSKVVNDSNSANDFSTPPFPERCRSCYELRLEKTAQQAREQGFDAFSTTLLISPYQDFDQIVSTGRDLSDKYNVLFHVKDYRPHFRDAMTLSKETGLYRQKYCGCIFSKLERLRKKRKSSGDRSNSK